MAVTKELCNLQSQSGNKICVDYAQKNLQWVSVSDGIFMCLECFGKHHGLNIHITSSDLLPWIPGFDGGGEKRSGCFAAAI
ncbi:hypothetical protein SLA2020_324070 [Shorea laevis]